MRVLVTGGTGFIGSHSVAVLLSQGHQVRLLVRSRDRVARSLSPLGVTDADVESVLGDVTAPGSVAEAMEGCDALLHAAAVYSFDVRAAARMREVNVRGTEIVLGAAVRAGLDPIVHVSSFAALLPPDGAVLTPDSPVKRPQGAYSRSKADSERVARRYQEQGAPVVIIYPGAVIGPHDPYLGESNRGILEFATSGLTIRGGDPWVDVRDVAKVHAAVMEPGRGPRRYMITGHYVALQDLTAMLHEIAGRPGRIVTLPASAAGAVGRMADLMQHITPGRLTYSHESMWASALQAHCDDSRTVKELGITPRDLRETLTDTVRWLAEEGHLSLARAEAAA